MFPAKLLANPPPMNALFARFDAWLNLSQRENAIVFVSVNINAIAIQKKNVSQPLSLSFPSSIHPPHPWEARRFLDSPTITNQITLNSLTTASTANPTHSAGTTYMLNQKNRLSVALTLRTLGSADSNTQWLSPVLVLTSFHQRSPTRRRPAMFFR